jgi:hypothetical protein
MQRNTAGELRDHATADPIHGLKEGRSTAGDGGRGLGGGVGRVEYNRVFEFSLSWKTLLTHDVFLNR